MKSGSVSIFFKLVCKAWRERLKNLCTYHWLDTCLEENSEKLLKLTINDGCHIYEDFFSKAVRNDNIKIVKFLHELNINHQFDLNDIKSVKIAKWLIKHDYNLKNCCKRYDILYEEDLSLEVISFLHKTFKDHRKFKELYMVCILYKGTIKNIARLFKKHYRFSPSMILCFASLEKLKYISENNICSFDQENMWDVLSSDGEHLEKIEYLRSKGAIMRVCIDEEPWIKISVDVLNELKDVDLNIFTYWCHNFDILLWRKENGYSISVVNTEDIEKTKWCLSLISKEDFMNWSNDICWSRQIILDNPDIMRELMRYSIINKIELFTYCTSSRAYRVILEYIKENKELLQEWCLVERLLKIGNPKLVDELINLIGKEKLIDLLREERVITYGNINLLMKLMNIGYIFNHSDVEKALYNSSFGDLEWFYKNNVKLYIERSVYPISRLDNRCKLFMDNTYWRQEDILNENLQKVINFREIPKKF